MKVKNLFFIFLFFIVIIIFGGMYFIGIMNLFMKESVFFDKFKWLDFGLPIVSIFYQVSLTIFFIVVIAIMSRLVMTLKNDVTKLTTANIDDFLIKPDNSKILEENEMQKEGKTTTSSSSNMNIEDDSSFEERLDSIFQNISPMTNDIIRTLSVGDLFEKVLFWGSSLSNSKRGSIMIVDKNKELYIYKTVGWSASEKQKIRDIKIPIGEGVSGKVALENKRIFVTNIETYEGFDFKFKDNYESNPLYHC